MKKPPAFPLYAQDFLTGVMYLTADEVGMYIKMLCKQWTDGNIPKKRLGFLIGKNWEDLSEELQNKFVVNDDFIYNERLEMERDKKKKFSEKQSNNGKLGGRPPKAKPFKTKKPNPSQIKPLEEEEEKEKVLYFGKSENLLDFEELNLFWFTWKEYKKLEFKFNYASIQSERAALNKLYRLSEGNEQTAIAIIEESKANGWKGFFEFGTNKQVSKTSQGAMQQLKDKHHIQ